MLQAIALDRRVKQKLCGSYLWHSAATLAFRIWATCVGTKDVTILRVKFSTDFNITRLSARDIVARSERCGLNQGDVVSRYEVGKHRRLNGGRHAIGDFRLCSVEDCHVSRVIVVPPRPEDTIYALGVMVYCR